MEGGSRYSEAAGGGSSGWFIRKCKPTSTVSPATRAAGRLKIMQNKLTDFLCRLLDPCLNQESKSDCASLELYATHCCVGHKSGMK